MTIKLGTVTVDPGANRATVIMPAGFDTVTAIRLSNYFGAVAIINNVQSNQMGQEYLHAFTQMVWRSPNVSSSITVTLAPTYPTGVVAPTLAQLANSLLVEASDDPENDFTGTYPYELGGLTGNQSGGAAGATTAIVGVPTDLLMRSLNTPNNPITLTFPATPGVTNYLTSLVITGTGNTAGGFIDASLTGPTQAPHFELGLPAAAAPFTPFIYTPIRPIPASGPNVAMVLNVPAGGAGNTAMAAIMTGYQA